MILLVDRNIELVEAWKDVFPPNVPIMQGDVLETRATTLVAPGNSSGSMTGGLDLAIAQKWPGIESRVRGHAPMEVGSVTLVPFLSDHVGYKYLLYAPTMWGAMDVSHTENAYLTMRAILACATSSPFSSAVVGTVVIPGLCSGVGRMPAREVARQMVRAYSEIREYSQTEIDA